MEKMPKSLAILPSKRSRSNTSRPFSSFINCFRAQKGNGMSLRKLISAGEHKKELNKLHKKSGLYILKNKFHPAWLKIGGGGDLKQRISSYGTNTPNYDDIELEAVAVKVNNKTAKGEKGRGRDYWRTAESRMMKLINEEKPARGYGSQEWRKTDVKKAVDLMKKLHFEGSKEFKADGRNMPFYRFEENKVVSESKARKKPVKRNNLGIVKKRKKPVKQQEYNEIRTGKRVRKPNSKLKDYLSTI